MGLKGRENGLKFCTTQKRTLDNLSFSVFRYGAGMLPQKKMLEIHSVPFRSNAKKCITLSQFRDPLESL